MFNIMSREKLVGFLILVTLASGLMMSVARSVHAQSVSLFILKGTLTDADGVALVGYTVEAPIAEESTFGSGVSITDEQGNYSIDYNDLSGAISVADEIEIIIKDPDGNVVGETSYIVTVADISPRIGRATHNIQIQMSGLRVELSNVQLPADGESTAEITVTIEDSDGAPVTDAPPSIEADSGSVGEVMDNGNGTYTVVYTAPALVITEPTADTITVTSDTTGDSTTATVTLQPVPTVIALSVEASVFTAGAGETGAIAISVSRGDNPVADANLSLGLTRADGGSDIGTVTDVANDGDGKYSATYTPSNAVGQVNITARDAVSGAIAITSVTVNAGPAAAITVTAVPTSVSSNGSAVITAAVADASGNGVGGLAPSGETESGTVGEFSEGATFGSYSATYNAGTVEEAGTDTVTVSVGDLSGQVTINLTPVPPKAVEILVVTGTVNKQDGTGPVGGVNVEVTVGAMTQPPTQTDSNGNYTVTFFNPGGVAGREGDAVTVVVTDDAGDERGRNESVLLRDELGEGNSADIVRDVKTDILARTTSLVVTGSVFREDSEVPIDDVFQITVMNTTRGTEMSVTTDENGMYVLTFFGTAVVAETGDELVVTASRDGGEWSSTQTLSSDEVEAGRAMVNVPTDIKASTLALAVTGQVFFEDGTVSVGAGVTVTSINEGRDALQASPGETDENGMYSVTFFTGDVVAETGDVIVVTAVHDGTEIGSNNRAVTSAEVDAARMEDLNVITTAKASATTLAVTGTAYYEDSMIPLGPGLTVTVVNNANGLESTSTTEEDGTFVVTLIAIEGVAAETGDTLTITVTSEEDGSGSMDYTLTAMEIDAKRVMVEVPTNIKASTLSLVVTGQVFFEDGTIAVGAGVTVTSMNEGRGLEAKGETDADGMYAVTFFTGDVVAESGDMISVTAVHDGVAVGTTEHMLSAAEVVAQRAENLNVITTVKASTTTLAVTGTAYYEGSTIPVGPGNTVAVVNNANGLESTSTTEEDGTFVVTLIAIEGVAAETGDTLTITITSEEDGSGSMDYTLTAMEIDAKRVMVEVPTDIKATSPSFLVTGTVFLEDGVSGAPAGLTVKVMNETQGINAEGWTVPGGGYVVTFLETDAAAVKTADELTFDVLVMADDETPIGETSVTLTSADVVAQRIDGIDITTSRTADPTNVFVVDGTVRDPSGNNVSAGVRVRVTLGDHAPRELQTYANGGYSAPYFDTEAPVASVYDTVMIAVVDRSTGDSAFVSMELASGHVLAQRATINVMLIPDDEPPVAVANVSQRFLDPEEVSTFDASSSTDNPLESQLIDTYVWDFGDGTSGSGMTTTHSYSKPGRYVVTLKVTDLAGNIGTAEREIFVSTVRLGGISLNTRHAREVLDKIISLAIAQTDAALQAGGPEQLLEMMRANPAMQAAVAKAIGDLLPPGFIPAQLLDEELPLIFEQYENIDLENFGNAVTARVDASSGLLGSTTPGFGRVVTGEKLGLYLVTPRADVGSVTFRFDEVTADAEEVIDSLPHTFQLEEEQAILLLPSLPGAGMDGVFSSATLMLASEELPAAYHNLLSRSAWSYRETSDYQAASMSPRTINGKIVWDVQVDIEPGKIYYYYYAVELANPVPLNLGADQPIGELSQYALPDPRNLQLQDRGLVEALFTPELQEAIAPLLNPILAGIISGQAVSAEDAAASLTPDTLLNLLGAVFNAAGPLFEEITQTMDPRMISVFTVPLVNEAQSLWHTSIDLSVFPDGVHTIDANAFDSLGVQIDNRAVFGKTFTLDRTAPVYDVSAAPGQNSSMYMNDDGELIATGLPPVGGGSPMATLQLMSSPNGDVSDAAEGLYQIIRVSDDPAEQASQTWVNILTSDMAPMFQGLTLDDFTAFLVTFPNLLTLNASAINGMVPEQTEMLIRGANSQPELIVGEYGLRVIARDSVFNMSTDTAPIRLNIVPPDPDTAMIVRVSLGDCNGDGDTDDLYETGVPEEMILFSDTPNVMLTAEIMKQVHPIASILVQYRMGSDGEWQDVGMVDAEMVAGAAVGSQYEVAWSIDNLGALIQAGMPVMVRAVVTNALSVSDTEAAEATLAVKDHPCPIEAAIHDLAHTVTDRNPDSDAPRGPIMLQAITRELTSPPSMSVVFEVLQGEEWQAVGEVTMADSVVDESIVDALEEALEEVVDGETSAVLVPTRRVWSFELDSTTLEDTIAVGDAAERDVTQDDNPYVLRAVAVDANGTRYESTEELSQSFSVDNVDDVPPLTGTEILQVADAAGVIEMMEGVFTVGGIVAEGVDAPVAMLMAMPIADPKTYNRVDVLINRRNDDGSLGDAVAEMAFEMGEENYTSTVDVSTLENGAYLFQALAMDEVGNQEVRDLALAISVDVANFIPPPEIDLNGQTVEEVTEAYPGGFPISRTYEFTVTGIALNAGDIDVLVDGRSANELGALTVTTVEEGASSTFTLAIDTTLLEEGLHALDLQVTKRNGSITFALAPLFVDNVAPELAVASPVANSEVSALPNTHATYNDGEGAGIELSSVSISLVRLTPPDMMPVEINMGGVMTDLTDLVYTRGDMLPGGVYRVSVTVSDIVDNVSAASADFTVVTTLPSVSILSPMPGQILDVSSPYISAVYTGIGASITSFMLDGAEVAVTDEMMSGNRLEYTPDALADGDHTVAIAIMDSEGNPMDDSVKFTVRTADTTPPLITAAGPQGVVKSASATLSAAASDEESGIASVSYALDGGAAVDGMTRDVSGLTPGTHTVMAVATNGAGLESTFSWTFTVELDTTPPVISTVAPEGIIKEASTTISAVIGDEQSSVTRVTISVDGAAARTASLRDGRASRALSGLTPGTHNVTVSAESTGGTATHTWSFTVELDTTPPVITRARPQGVVTSTSVTIAAVVTDEESAVTSATIALDGGRAIDVTPAANGPVNRRVTDLNHGLHGIELVATSAGGTATHTWTFTVDLDTTPPEVSTTSPHGIVRVEQPQISVAASDDRGGILVIDITLKDSDGKELSGRTQASSDTTSATFTPSGRLTGGTYSVDATVKDRSQNTASASWSFTVEFDTVPPSITVVAPQGESRISEERRPVITASYSDNLSGVDADSVVLMLDGNPVVPSAVSTSQVVYTPPADLAFGRHTVMLEVSDLATPSANTAAHEWSFVLEDGKGPVFRGVLRNYPNPFTSKTTVAFTLARESTLTIEIYDITGRLVRVLAQDEVREAGANEFPWDGKTSAGDVLARGVYFSQIMVTSEPKPEFIVLKMALLR